MLSRSSWRGAISGSSDSSGPPESVLNRWKNHSTANRYSTLRALSPASGGIHSSTKKSDSHGVAASTNGMRRPHRVRVRSLQ